MAHTIASDILQYENILREAGIPEKEANAHAKGMATFVENNLVKKEYLDYKLEILESRLESRLISKIGGVIVVSLTLGLSILGFFLKH
jgi:hypothetical protein